MPGSWRWFVLPGREESFLALEETRQPVGCLEAVLWRRSRVVLPMGVDVLHREPLLAYGRLLLVDVEVDAGEMPGFQRFDEDGLVEDLAAANIDEDGGGLHP